MNGESVDGGVSTPILASRPLPINVEQGTSVGLDFSKLPLVPRRTRTRSRAQELMHQTQIPIFMKRYCVVWHYRPQSRFTTAALSVFRLHNETVNIWSHAIGVLYSFLPNGAVIMSCLALWFSLSILTLEDMYKMLVLGHITENSLILLQAGVPIWPLVVFDIFSSVTMVLSALAHTFACLPKPMSSLFWKLDQLGIALGILSMYFPGVMYLFHGYPPEVPNRYILGISIVALACASVGVASAAFCSPAIKKGIRVAAYISMSACSLIPIAQVWNEQVNGPVYRLSVLRYVGCVAVAGYGALMYATGVPEMFRPGIFDLFGASHQLFHICIVISFVMFHMANVHLWAVLSSEATTAGLYAAESLAPAERVFATLLQQQ